MFYYLDVSMWLVSVRPRLPWLWRGIGPQFRRRPVAVQRLCHLPLLINHFLDGLKNQSVTDHVFIPQWDLCTVLEFLRGAPFEPLQEASLLLLTYKTVFLLALASSKGVSSIHGLGGRYNDVPFTNVPS